MGPVAVNHHGSTG